MCNYLFVFFVIFCFFYLFISCFLKTFSSASSFQVLQISVLRFSQLFSGLAISAPSCNLITKSYDSRDIGGLLA